MNIFQMVGQPKSGEFQKIIKNSCIRLDTQYKLEEEYFLKQLSDWIKRNGPKQREQKLKEQPPS